jgi:hypothetical protein
MTYVCWKVIVAFAIVAILVVVLRIIDRQTFEGYNDKEI